MGRPVPTNVIIEMNKRGFSDFDIIRYLRGKGYTPVEINDAMNHAKVKMELTRNAAEEKEEEILETQEKQSIHEPMKEETEKPAITELQLKQFVSLISSKLKTIEDRNKSQENAIDEIREQIPKIMQQQISSVKTLNADVQALQQTFSKILEPLAHNVKAMSGMLDMPREEKSSEKVEKEIKKAEIKEKKIAKQPKTKVIKKTVTITETKPTPAEKPEKPKKTKKSKEKTEKSKIIKTTVTKTEVKKSKKDPSLDDIF